MLHVLAVGLQPNVIDLLHMQQVLLPVLHERRGKTHLKQWHLPAFCFTPVLCYLYNRALQFRIHEINI